MNHFEIIATEMEKNFGSSAITVAAISSIVDLIDGDIVSFYIDFPMDSSESMEGKIILVTTKSIIETVVELPQSWPSTHYSIDYSSLLVNSKRVSIGSVISVNIIAPIRYWRVPNQNVLVGVTAIIKTLSGEEFKIIHPSNSIHENPKQDLQEILNLLSPQLVEIKN